VALSDDQKAMIRLLAQREQGYDDIGALMGIGVDEVRAKVKAALDGLDGGLSQDQKAILRMQAQREEGYGDIGALMGIGVDEVRAKVKDAVAGLDQEPAVEAKAPEAVPAPPPKPDPEPPAPAPVPSPPKPSAKPSAPAKHGPPASSSSVPKKKAAAPRLKLPEDKGARRALAAGAAVLVVIVVLLVTGVLGGGNDSGSGEATTTAAETTTNGESGTPTASGKQPTQALLSAVDGGNGRGQALFGRSGKTVIMLLSAKGLQPSPSGQSYTVSLVRSKTQRLPLVATKTKNGVIAGRFQIAPQVLGLLAGGFDQMELSLVDDNTLRVALADARKSKKAPNYEGTPVLSGPVTGPIVEAGETEAGN
jgi:hypothetical protein